MASLRKLKKGGPADGYTVKKQKQRVRDPDHPNQVNATLSI
jgi:hypothetical protein